MAKRKESVDELMLLLFGVFRSINLHLNEEHRKNMTKFSPLQLHALSFIKNKQNPLMKELADFLSITPPSATSLTDCMTLEGLIKRNIDAHDRRTARLSLTKKGARICREGFKERANHMREIFMCLTEGEREQLFKIYKKIHNHFNK